jgi:hypothetical protein
MLSQPPPPALVRRTQRKDRPFFESSSHAPKTGGTSGSMLGVDELDVILCVPLRGSHIPDSQMLFASSEI